MVPVRGVTASALFLNYPRKGMDLGVYQRSSALGWERSGRANLLLAGARQGTVQKAQRTLNLCFASVS